MTSHISAVRRGMHWIGEHQIITLAVWIAIASGIWIFSEILENVKEGDTRSFDVALLTFMRTPDGDPLGPGWAQEIGRDFSALGGVAVLSLLTLAVIGYLLLQRKGRAAIFVFVATSSGLLLSTILKMLIDRPRPDLFEHGSIVYTASFPSGHSMMAAVTYLTLGALLARIQHGRATQAFIMLCAGFLTLLIGASRVYLGVHWPTDVLAGWTAGATWALLCGILAQKLQRSGRIEPGNGQPAT